MTISTRVPLVLKTANSTSWSHIHSLCCYSLNVLVEMYLVSLTTKIPPHPNWWHNNPTGALTCPLFILYIWRTIRTHSTKSWKTATRCLKPFQTNIGNDKGAEIKNGHILPRGQWYAPSAVYSVIFCYTLLYSALHHLTLLYSALLCSTLFYSTLLCSTLLYSALL